jgi:hypothetical protein
MEANMHRMILPLVLVGGLSCLPSSEATPDGSTTAAEQCHGPNVFCDDFEKTGWDHSEEVRGACYGGCYGEYRYSTYHMRSGSQSLYVKANARGEKKQNHVIAGWQLLGDGQEDIWEYKVCAQIAAQNQDIGRTGPEFAILNARPNPGYLGNSTEAPVWSTGIQYWPFEGERPRGTWNWWQGDGCGLYFADADTAGPGWISLDEALELDPGQWYCMSFKVDYTANEYVGDLTVWEDGVQDPLKTWSLDGNKIIPECKRWPEGVFKITLEVENFAGKKETQDSCVGDTLSSAYYYTVFYDDVLVVRDTTQPGTGVVTMAVDVSGDTLTLEGTSTPYTAYFENGTGSALSAVGIQGYIDQGDSFRGAGGAFVGEDLSGDLPTGSSSMDWSLRTSNSMDGSGTLTPGAAIARIVLSEAGTVIATVRIPVTLVNPQS